MILIPSPATIRNIWTRPTSLIPSSIFIRYTGTPSGRIRCEGPVPNFPIPLPDGTFYDTLLEYCAAGIYYGGKGRGNQGGYCMQPLRSGRDYYRYTSFIHGSFGPAQSFSVYYCTLRCACDSSLEDLKTGYQKKTIELGSHVGELTRDRSKIELSTVAGNVLSLRTISLGSNRVQIYLSDKQKQPTQHQRIYQVEINLDLSEPPVRKPESGDQQQCSVEKTCRAPIDCNGCVCHVVPTKSTIDPVNQDSVFYNGLCGPSISLALVAVAGLMNGKPDWQQGFGSGNSKLRGRGFSFGERIEGIQLLPSCACNVSYVSVGCCQAVNGITWEDQELQLGHMVDFVEF